jgi:hypothetical protein
MRSAFGVLLVMILVAGTGHGTIREVPGNYATIQAAINAAVDGDTVLVNPGTFLENINFRGKNIVVGSRYILDGDPAHITSTVINGGTPVSPDTASCVLIISHEDTSAVLEGFTLTAGNGTAWRDEHGAGVFREGGGILIALSSPTIRNNLIIGNKAVNAGGLASAGGGGIRSGDGSPRILNNVIMLNRGLYGGGIVLNYCSDARVSNNVVTRNTVSEAYPGKPTYGGGGIWINNVLSGNPAPNRIENNTIVGNVSLASQFSSAEGRGGGVLLYSGKAVLRNNIVWENHQSFGQQADLLTGSLTAAYNDVQGGYVGGGNINVAPIFLSTGFMLASLSPCIDAGDTSADSRDPEDILTPGLAAYPSLGTVRNDMGAYGGPRRSVLPAFSGAGIFLTATALDFGYRLPGGTSQRIVRFVNTGADQLMVDSIRVLVDPGAFALVNSALPRIVAPGMGDSLLMEWAPAHNGVYGDTLLLYHNDPFEANPARVTMTGNADPTPQLDFNMDQIDFGSVDVNVPRRDTTLVVRNIGTGPDSVYVTLNYSGLKPEGGIAISPPLSRVAPGDSQALIFTFFPPLITRTFLSVYSPRILVDSRFGLGTTHFEKTMRFKLVGTLDVPAVPGVPTHYTLDQNYPNPFNPSTTIRFGVPERARVQLRVYTLLGQLVATIVDGELNAGYHEVRFDGGGLGSGAYFYRIEAGSFTSTRAFIVVK